MAPIATELATLRALTFRISSTPPSQLPQHVPAIAASLANCRTLLSSTQAPGAKATSSEASVAVHKYRTLLSTLLQDRTFQGRWAAIVLIKATIESGGWETLQKCLPWVRGLLGFLNKPDPPSSKRLCIITLTRIFILTREYPTLIREITTPSLPAFVQTSLQIASPKAPVTLLQTILESFNELLPRHPTIFRSHLKQIQPLLARLIAPTPSNKLSQEQDQGSQLTVTSDLAGVARQLYVQIPCCAPKGASGEDWGKAMKSTINSAHLTADLVFRAVLEDWQSSTHQVPATNGHTLDDEVQNLETDAMGLLPWSGIFAGSERLTGVLFLVKEHLESPTSSPVYLNLGAIMDLVTRMLSLAVPASGDKAFQNTTRINNQVSKEERENLWLLLPDMHVAAIEILLSLAHRFQASTLSLGSLIVDQLVWVFGSEKDIPQVRVACYLTIATLLKQVGAALPKSVVDSLGPLIRACCDDLLPSEVSSGTVKSTPGQVKANGNSQPQANANADTFLNASKSISDPTAGFIGLKEAAYHLLPVLLANIGAQYFSDSMRARLDRTAILTQHKDAMVASVLNPPPSRKFGKPAASILPLMARSFPQEMDIEGMLRPRMPVIRLGGRDVDVEDDGDDGDDSAEDDEKQDEEQEDVEDNVEHFVGQELDNLLESAEQNEPAVRDFAMQDAPEESKSTGFLEAPGNNTISTESKPSAIDLTQFTDAGKRSFGDDVPPSPSKRVKTDEEQSTTHPISSISSVQTRSQKPASSSIITPASDFTATSTASTIPELPQPSEGPGEVDSDEDDVVPLVFGQDTDDESE